MIIPGLGSAQLTGHWLSLGRTRVSGYFGQSSYFGVELSKQSVVVMGVELRSKFFVLSQHNCMDPIIILQTNP